MTCQFHPNNEANIICPECGSLICGECVVDIGGGRQVCKRCVDRIYSSRKAAGPDLRIRYARLLPTLLLSVIPGAAHMYLGLMKRGILIMCAFFLAMTLSALSVLIGICATIIFIAALFDALSTRGKILSGYGVNDDVDDILSFARRYKVFFIIIAICAVVSVVDKIVKTIIGGIFGSGPLTTLLGIIIIAGGVWLILKAFKRPK